MSEFRQTYLEVTQEAGRDFMTRGLQGEVVMLNLLRFRDEADYSEAPHLAPTEPISGAEAYERYVSHTRPFLEKAGGTMDFAGDGGRVLIGPADEYWDVAMLVRHRSVEAFMSFATNEDFLAGMGHRTAAISDSRLLPLVPRGLMSGKVSSESE